MRVLDRLAARYPVDLRVIAGRQVSHDEALRMKRRSHIVIDECVTGSYHRNSLEGLAAGCVVVNGVGTLPGVLEALRACTGEAVAPPFVRATLDDLEAVLVRLVEQGTVSLRHQGAAGRAWMERHWSFAAQWRTHWMPLVESAWEARPAAPARARAGAGSAARLAASASGAGAARTARTRTAAVPEGAASIPLYWTCRDPRRGNFGDMLSPPVVRALSGRAVRYEARGPKLFAVGSLLKFARRGDAVWGTGFIQPQDVCDRGIEVFAVRGPLTRRRLLELGVDCPEVYGDPALLLPWVYRLPANPRRGIGIIPHYVDAGRIAVLARDPTLRIIDIRAGIGSVLDEVSRCEVLLSSSLHGCVAGDAYGIPTAWVRIGDRVVGGAFKFEDYYGGTGREATCVDWRRRIDVDAGVSAAVRTPPPDVDLEALLRAFPFRDPSRSTLDALAPRATGARATRTAPVLETSSTADPMAAGKARPAGAPEPAGAATRSGIGGRGSSEGRASRLAVFSAGTEDYVGYIVTAMRSFMRHPEQRPMDFHVLGRGFSPRSLELLRRHGIHYLDLDLTDVFPRGTHDRYPSECFWIFKGPELFHELGYEFSLSVDGDVWCNRPLDLDWLPEVRHLAGIRRGKTVGDFLSRLGGYPLLRRHFGISDAAGRREATQTAG
jgi:pyruvyltransferase